MPGQLREGNVEYVAADIVEIHVDAGGAVRAQGLAHVLALVVDRRIEPEFIDDVAALRGAASNPDRAATFDLGDLADRRRCRPERCRIFPRSSIRAWQGRA